MSTATSSPMEGAALRAVWQRQRHSRPVSRVGAAGVFRALWQAGMAEYDEMEGIAWRWQSIDGALVKAPLAQESVGANPTDRGGKWKQANAAGRRAWHPAVAHRERGQLA